MRLLFLALCLFSIFHSFVAIDPQDVNENTLLPPSELFQHRSLQGKHLYESALKTFDQDIIFKNTAQCQAVATMDRTAFLERIQNSETFSQIAVDLGRNKFPEFNVLGSPEYRTLSTILFGMSLSKHGSKYIQAFSHLLGLLLKVLSPMNACVIYKTIIEHDFIYNDVSVAERNLALLGEFKPKLKALMPEVYEVLEYNEGLTIGMFVKFLQSLMIDTVPTDNFPFLVKALDNFIATGANSEAMFASILTALRGCELQIRGMKRNSRQLDDGEPWDLVQKKWPSCFESYVLPRTRMEFLKKTQVRTALEKYQIVFDKVLADVRALPAAPSRPSSALGSRSSSETGRTGDGLISPTGKSQGRMAPLIEPGSGRTSPIGNPRNPRAPVLKPSSRPYDSRELMSIQNGIQ